MCKVSWGREVASQSFSLFIRWETVSERALEEKTISAEDPVTLPPMKVIRVLLIDDDKIQLSLTAAMLKQQELTPFVVSNWRS